MNYVVLMRPLINALRHKKIAIELKEWAMKRFKIVSLPTSGIFRKNGLMIDILANMHHHMYLMALTQTEQKIVLQKQREAPASKRQ